MQLGSGQCWQSTLPSDMHCCLLSHAPAAIQGKLLQHFLLAFKTSQDLKPPAWLGDSKLSEFLSDLVEQPDQGWPVPRTHHTRSELSVPCLLGLNPARRQSLDEFWRLSGFPSVSPLCGKGKCICEKSFELDIVVTQTWQCA